MKRNTKTPYLPNIAWLACCLSICMFLAYGQARAQLSIINSPAGYEAMFAGYFDSPIEVNGILYMRYQDNSNNYVLAKYDGTTLTIIPNPVGYQGAYGGYVGSPIVVNGILYMQYRGEDSNHDLAKYDGTTLTIIPSPTGYEAANRGYGGITIAIGSTLYMGYLGNDGNGDLAKYDGTTLTIIPSPTGYENAFRGYRGNPIVVGSTLYMQYRGNDDNADLAKYDGTTLTIIPSPVGYESSNAGYFGNPAIIGSTLYMQYRGNDDNADLAKYDGTTLTIIPSPAGYESSNAGYFGNPAIIGSTLYMQYRGNDDNYDLAQYDGTTLTIIPSPTGYDGSSNGYTTSSFVVGSTLYMNYQGNDSKYSLAKYESATLTIIPNPVNYQCDEDFIPVAVGGVLYIRYIGNDNKDNLAKYDGTTLTIISNPAGYEYNGRPIVVDGNLYMQYRNNSGSSNLANYDGTTLTMIPNPTGFENSGYQGIPVAIGSTLYLRYTGNDDNNDLARYIAPSPEINLQGNGQSIANLSFMPTPANHTDFGLHIFNTPIVRTFTIQNTGTTSLEVSSINSINPTDWSNSADFTVGGITLPTTIAAGGSAIFTVTMEASATASTKEAVIIVNNNDANENEYTFLVQGRIINALPTGVRGNMMSFDGVDDYIGIAHSASFDIKASGIANFCMDFWVKLDNVTGTKPLFYKGADGLRVTIVGTEIDAMDLITDGANLMAGEWYHIAIIYNQDTGIQRIYINGVQQATTGSIGDVSGLNDNTESIRIGSDGTNYFGGVIEEFRLWNRSLSLSQIRKNMHLTLSGEEQFLSVYYQFNEESGNTIDAVGGNNGTINGAARVASTLSVGKGVSKLVSVTSVGAGAEISLDNTQMEIDFSTSSANPNEEILVTQITAETPLENTTMPIRTTSCYWVIRNFGTNTGLAFDNMRFRIPNHNLITNDDETSPANLKLYRRITNIGTNSWTQIASANSASNTTKEINFPAPTNTSFSEFIIGSTSSPLPITLVRFTGERVTSGQDNGFTEEVKLEWSTASEINNKGFEVEMSENGLAYQKIAFVEGAGSSNAPKHYTLNTKNSNDSYYRLKQLDFDGKFSYSPVVFVEGIAGKVKIYPNPNKGTFTISVGKDKLDSPARLLNVVGKEVWHGTETEVHTTDLPNGIYFLHTTTAGKAKVTKVVIER